MFATDVLRIFILLTSDNGLHELLPGVRKYFRLKSKIKNLSADIKFLNLCLKNDVSPNFINKHLKKKSNLNTDWKQRKRLERKLIQDEISNHYGKRSELELVCYDLHLNISKVIPRLLWDILEDDLYSFMHRSFYIKKERL